MQTVRWVGSDHAGSARFERSGRSRRTDSPGELAPKAAEMVGRVRIPVRGDRDNDLSLAFANGSRIVGLQGMGGGVRRRGWRSDVPGAAADAGGRRGFVVNKHAFPEKGALLPALGAWRGGVAQFRHIFTAVAPVVGKRVTRALAPHFVKGAQQEDDLVLLLSGSVRSAGQG